MLGIVVLILVIVLLVLRRWKLQKFVELSKELKCGIKSYPLIGHAYLFAGNATRRMKAITAFGKEAINNGGITYTWLGPQFYAVLADAVDIEVILKTSLEKDDIIRFGRNLIGNGLIFAPVPIWRPRRKISAPAFSPANLNRFAKIFIEQSESLVERVKEAVGNEAVSVWKYMTTYTFYSVCETALGIKMNSNDASTERVLESFDRISKLVAERMCEPWLQPNAIYKLLPYHNNFEKNKKVLYKFVNESIIATRKKLKEKNKTDSGDTNGITSFLELYIEASGRDRGYSDEELLEEALVMLFAGTDTSAIALCFTIYLLANYPRVQEKLFQELQDVFGDSDRSVATEDLPRLKYLEAVLRESMRLYPPVPLIVRVINEDTKLPSGVTLHKGCPVSIHIWSTHRNPVYWGDDAELFRPERFLEGPLKHPAALLTFSHGPRSCLGYPYSLMSLKIALATFLRKYRVLSKDGNVGSESVEVKYDIMIKDVDGFRVRLVERTN